MSRYNVFQYKVSDQMSYLTALYDNFEIFQKKFNGEEFSKIEGHFAKFQPIFNLKTILNSKKDRRINFWAIGAGSCKSGTTPLPIEKDLNTSI